MAVAVEKSTGKLSGAPRVVAKVAEPPDMQKALQFAFDTYPSDSKKVAKVAIEINSKKALGYAFDTYPPKPQDLPIIVSNGCKCVRVGEKLIPILEESGQDRPIIMSNGRKCVSVDGNLIPVSKYNEPVANSKQREHVEPPFVANPKGNNPVVKAKEAAKLNGGLQHINVDSADSSGFQPFIPVKKGAGFEYDEIPPLDAEGRQKAASALAKAAQNLNLGSNGKKHYTPARFSSHGLEVETDSATRTRVLRNGEGEVVGTSDKGTRVIAPIEFIVAKIASEQEARQEAKREAKAQREEAVALKYAENLNPDSFADLFKSLGMNETASKN